MCELSVKKWFKVVVVSRKEKSFLSWKHGWAFALVQDSLCGDRSVSAFMLSAKVFTFKEILLPLVTKKNSFRLQLYRH